MPIALELLKSATSETPQKTWDTIVKHVWDEFSEPLPVNASENEVVKRDRNLTELDNLLSGSAWDLWNHFETAVPKVSESIVDFWNKTQGGKAVLILDGLSLREIPWLLKQAEERGYRKKVATVRGTELPAETTPFANSLGFAQRSALDNNGAGGAHKLTGAFTISSNLPWLECVDQVGSQESFVFWHHWPDERLHDLAVPGAGIQKLAKEIHATFSASDFWQLIERLCTGRTLLITSDHGYAATGLFHDLVDKEQASYMKTVFRSGRCSSDMTTQGTWVPPIDIQLTSAHGEHRYVLGRRKWKSAAGYPALQHGGLSLLEVLVPFVILSK